MKESQNVKIGTEILIMSFVVIYGFLNFFVCNLLWYSFIFFIVFKKCSAPAKFPILSYSISFKIYSSGIF